MATYESLINSIGGCGNYQIFCFIWYFLSALIIAPQMGYMMFGNVVPRIECSQTGADISEQGDNVSQGAFFNSSLEDMLPLANASSNCVEVNNFYSVAQEWQLFGSRKVYLALITSMQMTGVLFGPLLAGIMSDRYGRRLTFLTSFVILTACGLLATFSVSWQMFAAARFLIGLSCGGTFSVSYVLLMECIPAKWRLFITLSCWPIGFVWLGVLAKLTNHWKWLSMWIVICSVPVLVTSLGIYESPKWLLELGYKKRAISTLNKIARRNRSCRPRRLEGGSTNDTVLSAKDVIFESYIDDLLGADFSSTKKRRQSYPFWYLFYSKSQTLILTALIISNFTIGLSHYVLLFILGNFAGDVALNCIYTNLARWVTTGIIPGVLDTKFAWLGRKTLLLFSLVGLGFFILLLCICYAVGLQIKVPFMPLLLTIGANCFGGLIWAALGILAIESNPTEVRNTATSVCNFGARIGSILAPQVVMLFDFWKPCPFIVMFAIVSINLVIAFLLITETKGKPLPDLPDRLKLLPLNAKK